MFPLRLPRPSSVRESRILRIVFLTACVATRPWRWRMRVRALEQAEDRKRLSPAPPEPRPPSKIGKAEWEERMAALGTSVPSCLDAAELGLSDAPLVRCLRTGLVLERGRCAPCPCKTKKGKPDDR